MPAHLVVLVVQLILVILVVSLDLLRQRRLGDSSEGIDGLSKDGHGEAAALPLHRRHRCPSVVAWVIPAIKQGCKEPM